jgi:KUP system potassium uptake protein
MPDAELTGTELAETESHGHHGQGRQGSRHGASGKPWLFPAIAAIGIVYGDIGTSPLYAFQVALGATGRATPVPADILGIVSLIFWAIVFVVAIKYVTVVMRADNDGEGGILALLALVTAGRKLDHKAFPILVILGIVGAAFIYGDGIITPAISVLSALEGLDVAAPGLDAWILPITLVILVILFSFQVRGAGDIGKLFGPIMIVWFLTISVLGLVNILHNPAILAAVNPIHALLLLVHGGKNLLPVIGAAFLALTGAEALYADMGHFGAKPIRIAWFAVVLPALALSYFGQGALVLGHPSAAANPFFEMAPKWAALPLVILAAMATIIASQALISGAFSLTRQAIQMRLMPRMMIRSTSGRHQGQIYLGAINWALMVGSIVVVLIFRTSTHLAAAYGIAVSGTMLVTSILLYNVVRRNWHWPALAAFFMIGVFATGDLVFLDANATKFLEGGWFPLIVGVILAFLMLVWRSGALEVQRRLDELATPFDQFLTTIDDQVLARIPGCAVFTTRGEHYASPVLVQQVRHNKVLHEDVILMRIEPVGRPFVHARERLEIETLGHGFHRVTVRLGFLQVPDLPIFVKGCARMGLKCAAADVHYYLAYEHVARRQHNPYFPLPIWHVYNFMSKMGIRLTDFLRVPEEHVFEIGIKIQI